MLADKVDPAAVVDDAMVTLLAGETATFRIRSSADVDPQAFLTRPSCGAPTSWSAAERRTDRPRTTPLTEQGER